MKNNHPRITLLGNNSGRNLGDMAILSSILESLSKRLPDAEFYVPSVNPEWTKRHYGSKYNVHAIDAMPWKGSVRLLGIPTYQCFMKSDVALICDGIIFGKGLWNPAFNYLITLAPLMPLAKLAKCKVVCYSCGIGPFPNALSKKLGKFVIEESDLIMMRERDSEKLAREIGVTKPIELTGDAAFINPVSSPERGQQILRELDVPAGARLLAVNATSYLDTWLNKGERLSDPSVFIDMLAAGINAAKNSVTEPFYPLIVCTQPMDEEVCRRLATLVGGKLITNSLYLSHDIQAVLRECQLLLGMRFHSTVLASSVETPVVGLIYAPKVRGYMRLLECEDFALELAGLTTQSLAEKLSKAWNARRELQERQRPIIAKLKSGAEHAADLLVERYYPERVQTSVLQAGNSNL